MHFILKENQTQTKLQKDLSLSKIITNADLSLYNFPRLKICLEKE